jgi:hypothetical protein
VLSTSTGVISGMTTGSGISNFTVRVTDAKGQSATQALSITVNSTAASSAAAAVAITTTALPNGVRNALYGTALDASGGQTPYSWSLSSGDLPAGLTLAASGAISGTPTATGTTNFTVRVTDAKGKKDTQALSITVNSTAAAVAITTTALPDGTQNSAYSATLAASGGQTPYGWSLSSGGLPAGLTLAASGVISGTPTGSGTSNFTVRVTDANGQSATQALSITVNTAAAPPAITTTSLPSGAQNSAYSAILAASGGQTPYSWSLSSGGLPVGLVLASSTGVITGLPTGSGTSNFTVRVTDANGQSATRALSITISPAGGSVILSVALQWDASTSPVIGYNVYRSSSSGGAYTKLNSTLLGGTSYTDNTVGAGQTYYYVVRSVDSTNMESVPSNEAVAAIF